MKNIIIALSTQDDYILADDDGKNAVLHALFPEGGWGFSPLNATVGFKFGYVELVGRRTPAWMRIWAPKILTRL